jgi:hypothetical protein
LNKSAIVIRTAEAIVFHASARVGFLLDQGHAGANIKEILNLGEGHG